MPLSRILEPRTVRGSAGRLLILLPFIGLVLGFGSWCLASWKPGDLQREAGAFHEARVAAASGNVTLQITVTGFRAGSLDDLSGFDVPLGDHKKVPHYVWFTAKLASGIYHTKDPFPITADQWGAVSSDGTTLRGVLLSGQLQPCPQIDTERLAAGEPAEGCFMVFNETGRALAEASLKLGSGEIRGWNF